MADLPENSIITTNGSYELYNLEPGEEYLIAFGTASPATRQINVMFPIGAGPGYIDVDDNSFLGENPMSKRFISPGNSLMIVMGGSGDPVKVTVRESVRQVK